jgi:lysophospholipase L1-like esterase
MAFGDSLVEGYGAPGGSDFVTKLSERIGVPIKNFGKNGDTTALGLARAQALDERPDIVIILLGGNDALQKVPKEETKENLARLIEIFQSYQSKRIRVVLVGVIGGFPSDPYAQMFKDIAKEHNVPLVPNILSGVFANQEYMSDQVHPNAAGYEKIAERLAPILNSVCGEYKKDI